MSAEQPEDMVDLLLDLKLIINHGDHGYDIFKLEYYLNEFIDNKLKEITK